MSIKLVRNEIERFLAGTEPEILCISGKWGVGKTFSWNYYLTNASKVGRIGLKRYAYVSLFGLKTLNELKYALYEATQPTKDIGKKLQWDDLESGTIFNTLKTKSRWALSHLSRIPRVQNYVGITEKVLFYFVGKQLICIDDLERAGSGLDVTDVFGLISFLKEQRGCRVALLLNREAMPNTQKEVFEKQFEKVVDTYLEFDPTPKEAADIVFPNPKGLKGDLHDRCVILGIVNIRVIKKIERICDRLEEILKPKYSDLLYQASHSATLFAWSKYQKDSSPPPIAFLKDVSRLHGFSHEKNDFSEDEKGWQALMQEYNFTNVDDFDLAIHQAVESGIFDPEMLLRAAEKQSQGVAKATQEKLIRDTWGLYHGSFDDNETEALDTIFRVSLENVRIISVPNLDATVRILKEFGRSHQAEDLIKRYVEARPNEKAVYDLRNDPFGSHVKDPDVRKVFENKLAEFVDKRNPADVLEAMILNHGWNTEDVELIEKLTINDFYNIFKKEKGDRLHRIVRAALQLNKSRDDSVAVPIAEKATDALKKIGQETRLNRKRVAAMGVQLGDEGDSLRRE